MAGYSWKWVTKGRTYEKCKEEGLWDIDIDGHHYIWNTDSDAWITSEHSVDEIGCVHTTQGFDLNYVGVIFGKEIDYDPVSDRIVIDPKQFHDVKVKFNTDEEKLHEYIINTYKVLLTRGIKGCYVYVCNENLRRYLNRFIDY